MSREPVERLTSLSLLSTHQNLSTAPGTQWALPTCWLVLWVHSRCFIHAGLCNCQKHHPARLLQKTDWIAFAELPKVRAAAPLVTPTGSKNQVYKTKQTKNNVKCEQCFVFTGVSHSILGDGEKQEEPRCLTDDEGIVVVKIGVSPTS